MKMNKKGFTLIELLAVIVILAIIALIATPIILNVISEARKSAAKDAAYGYFDAVEKYVTLSSMNVADSTCDSTAGVYDPDCVANSTYDVTTWTAINSTVKGTKPTSGSVIISGGQIGGSSSLTFGDYTFTASELEIAS